MIEVKSFGDDVDLITITANNGNFVELINFGARIRSINIKNGNDNFIDIVQGYDTLEEYINDESSMGAIVGRCANRIGEGEFSIENTAYSLVKNDGNNHIHGGNYGFSKKFWDYCLQENSVKFHYFSPHNDEGYPGNLDCFVTYHFNGNTLSITMEGIPDEKTIINLTNHSYFNLSGHGNGKIDDHLLWVNSDFITKVDCNLISTGDILSVEGTIFDFNSFKKPYDCINDSKLEQFKGFDNNYILKSSIASVLKSQTSGIQMEIHTSLPGAQLYTANFLSSRVGKGGTVYVEHSSICFEPQFFPNAVKIDSFDKPIFSADKTYNHMIKYIFKVI